MSEKISQMPAAAALTGAELVPVVQSGDNVKTTTQDIANLGGGGGGTPTISAVLTAGNDATGKTIQNLAGLELVTGNEGLGKVLVSDANGLGDWEDTASYNFMGLAIGDLLKYDGTDWINFVPAYITAATTDTLTNKRWTARVGSAASSATPTINTDNFDIYKLTAQAADITSFTTNLSGTPVDGDVLEIQITGTAARAITWGASFVSTTVTLPSTTVTTVTLTIILQFYSTSSYGNNKWHCVNTY